MSTAKLTLRPPPNVEFVQGYPGIPPGPDRPQAAVKGSIELRAGHQGIKAKWVRIELRKVETLPGGGQANTFFDFVGQSPVNVWQTSEEYGILETQDFPFYIRIPESIPPSLALEKGFSSGAKAGVKYELVAQVCIKAKKGFLRRDKSTILSTSSPIIIDKHELHATWPLYQQPESRHMSQEGVLLTADRNSTCYGPGDRVSVMATLKSDSLQTVILRGFEFTLRETTVFRAGGQATGKRAAPQSRVSVIGEQKVPVNATLYGGTQHRAELTCLIPQHHTTATLASARHIDITYVISIKALMGTGKPLTMELPVVISNWPRAVSAEAVRRIGPTANLSLLAPHPVHSNPIPAPQSQPQYAASLAARPVDPIDPGRAFNTMPIANPSVYPPRIASPPLTVDEFGRPEKDVPAANGLLGFAGTHEVDSVAPLRAASPPGVGMRTSYATNGEATGSVVGRNPRGSTNPNRLTVTNFNDDDDVPSSMNSLLRRPSSREPDPTTGKWVTAEEEKRRLYESAKANVDRVQGAAVRGESPPPVPQIPHSAVAASRQPASSASSKAPWLTAEEEKTRLYHQAQAQAQRVQGYAGSMHGRTNSDVSDSSHLRGNAVGTGMSSGAALYQQAMSSMNRNPSLPTPGASSSGAGSSSQAQSSSKTSKPHYPSAEEEKAMLRRYQDAKAAVDRTQIEPYDAATPSAGVVSAYDAMYSAAPAPPQNHMPPSISQSSSQQPLSAYEEKERLRRQYEAQDQVGHMPTPQPYVNGSYAYPSPAPTNGYPSPVMPDGSAMAGGSSSAAHQLSEKEMLRRKFDADDAAALRPPSGPPPMPPAPRSVSGMRSPGPRSPPLPPPSAGAYQPLSAAEEKARLRAQYASEEVAPGDVPGYTPAQGNVPAPPPLMPRPPPDYIHQTRTEDSRSQLGHGAPSGNHGREGPERVYTPMNPSVGGFAVDDAETFGGLNSRPPIPPKVPMQ